MAQSENGRQVLQHGFEPNPVFWAFVTTGISCKPMPIREKVQNPERYEHAEIVMLLDPSWPEMDHNPDNPMWPVDTALNFAGVALRGGWIWGGHTYPIKDEDLPDACGYTAAILLPNILPDRFESLELSDGRDVVLLYLAFLYPEEWDHCKQHGSQSLLALADEKGISRWDLYLTRENRRNICD